MYKVDKTAMGEVLAESSPLFFQAIKQEENLSQSEDLPSENVKLEIELEDIIKICSKSDQESPQQDSDSPNATEGTCMYNCTCVYACIAWFPRTNFLSTGLLTTSV